MVLLFRFIQPMAQLLLMLEAGNIDGAAIGLDSGSSEKDFEEAAKRNPNVPSFSSETYPGWLTHWGENCET